jgi:transcription initiation factor TFIID TATA-box-binding protein
MESLTTHPSTAQQAKAFTSPASLSFPGGAGDLTPPSSEKDGQNLNGGSYANGKNAQSQGQVAPQTPSATPGAGVSGIVPTLQ